MADVHLVGLDLLLPHEGPHRYLSRKTYLAIFPNRRATSRLFKFTGWKFVPRHETRREIYSQASLRHLKCYLRHFTALLWSIKRRRELERVRKYISWNSTPTGSQPAKGCSGPWLSFHFDGEEDQDFVFRNNLAINC